MSNVLATTEFEVVNAYKIELSLDSINSHIADYHETELLIGVVIFGFCYCHTHGNRC